MRIIINSLLPHFANPIFTAGYADKLTIFFEFDTQPPVGQDLLIHEVSRSHTTTYYSLYDPLDK